MSGVKVKAYSVSCARINMLCMELAIENMNVENSEHCRRVEDSEGEAFCQE
ncbi:MAG: hypothetical protein NWF01_00130 [Candidatus Bathyarchaeota archaeon]|nr:hypothetical protein [Candidatus Bathyarchaeota archaeon]